jgi:predicted anti-sigma-YlaC factor YlaD
MARLKTIWHLLNLPCREMTRLASESLDRDLGRLERVVLKSHLLYCISCRRYLRQVLFLRRALRQVAKDLETGRSLPGLSLPDDVRARIKQALRES